MTTWSDLYRSMGCRSMRTDESGADKFGTNKSVADKFGTNKSWVDDNQ